MPLMCEYGDPRAKSHLRFGIESHRRHLVISLSLWLADATIIPPSASEPMYSIFYIVDVGRWVDGTDEGISMKIRGGSTHSTSAGPRSSRCWLLLSYWRHRQA